MRQRRNPSEVAGDIIFTDVVMRHVKVKADQSANK